MRPSWAGENDDALCAVCGGGHSEAPNCIVFCDRCDVAVHQACYDLDTLPQGASHLARCMLSWNQPSMAGAGGLHISIVSDQWPQQRQHCQCRCKCHARQEHCVAAAVSAATHAVHAHVA